MRGWRRSDLKHERITSEYIVAHLSCLPNTTMQPVRGAHFGLHLQPQFILLPRHGTRSGSGSGLLSNLLLFPHTRTCLATLAPALPLTDALLMISDKTGPVRCPVIDRVPIVRTLLPITRIRVSHLPKSITCHTRVFQAHGRLLPLALHGAVLSGIRAAVLFEETRLVQLLADLRVRLNPSVAERVGNAPRIWVQVKCAK